MEQTMERRLEIGFGLCLLLVLAVFFVVGLSYPPRPRELPLLADGLGMLLVMIHLVNVVRAPVASNSQVAAWNWKAVFICLAAMAAYLSATLIVGMVLASAILVYGSGIAFGAKSRGKMALVAAATVMAMYVLFVLVLRVPLYRGLLGDRLF
jgi:hypothetical protein